MKTIKIYKVETTDAYRTDERGTGFSLEPFGNQTANYKGTDDGGINYILPAGYRVGISRDGSLRLYDSSDLEVKISGRTFPSIDGYRLRKFRGLC